jgi:hypothetical protein
VQLHDNHPDLTFGPGVAQFIEQAGNPETILALLDEIDRLNAEWMAKCEELRKITHELRTYNPAADEYKGVHVHKGWARRIDAALAKKEGA